MTDACSTFEVTVNHPNSLPAWELLEAVTSLLNQGEVYVTGIVLKEDK